MTCVFVLENKIFQFTLFFLSRFVLYFHGNCVTIHLPSLACTLECFFVCLFCCCYFPRGAGGFAENGTAVIFFLFLFLFLLLLL